MSKILGIDLGTTFSAMAVMESGEPKIIENKEGTRTTPSVVALAKNNERLVGVLARRQQITNPENTIFSTKRLIGRRFSDPQVQKDKELLPYQIQESKDGGIEIKIGDKWYQTAEISAMILQKLKQDAEEKLGEKITDAIITCPAYFDDSQRKQTKVAGEIAGLNVKMVLNEPTAAALAYGLAKKANQQILVYDFGGGTFDVSILDIRKDPDTIEVIGVGGDTHLGGDDFDKKIMDWIIDQFKKEQGIDLSKDQLALQRIKETAEKAKIELSTTLETEINLPFITSDANGPKHLLYKLSRAQFEDLVREYIDKSIELVKEALKDAKLEAKDIEEIVLVGGQIRMPAIHKAVKDLFNKEPNMTINPDEVVAIGAAIQGGIMGGDTKEVLLLDATPLSLGIETEGRVNTILIPKNTTYPTDKTQIFSTATENQTSVEVHVLQGERPMAQDCKTLGRFILDGIPSAPRGVPQIEVKFDIDVNGILSVSAKDKATNKSQSIKIEASVDMSQEEIERMKKDAELHNEEDKKKKELISARNLADNLIYSSEKTLKETGDKINPEMKKRVEEKIESLKKMKDSDNIEDIKKQTTELSEEIQKAGAEMYKQATPEQKPEESKQDSKDIEEGEFKEKIIMDYYKVLGISKDASSEEVKKAFHRLAHQHHPHKGGDEKKFKEINEAYQVLSNKEKRAQYDKFGQVFDQAPNTGNWAWGRISGEGVEMDFDPVDLGEMFEDFFSFRQGSQRKDIKRGRNIRIDIGVSLEEILKGVDKKINLKKLILCSRCQGTGGEPNTKVRECFSCRGTGQVQEVRKTFLGSFTKWAVCPECFGEGQKPEKPCNVCKGEGRIKGDEDIDIFIPAGVDSNQVLKIDNQGNVGKRQANPGDLYVRILIKEHPIFIRQGDDIILSAPISYSQAVLGDEIEIPSLDDKPIMLKVPFGTESGKILRVKGKGIPHFSGFGRGNLYVELVIDTPRKLSKEQRELLEKLKKAGL